MTTSEFILGHSADDAADRKQEARKVVWALLAALLIHLVVAYSLAISSGLFSSPISVDDKPMQLTIVDLPPPAPAAPKNSMFVETDDSRKSAQQPKDKTFESNANSIAASQMPATGSMPLPSQQGKDQPSLDLDSHQYSLASQGAPQPQPSAAPKATPEPVVASTPEPTPVPKEDEFAMLTSTPKPAVQPTVAARAQRPNSSYRALKEKTRLSGAITTRGISSVNAIGTPLGRYQKWLLDAIGSRWYAHVEQYRDLISIGTARLVFWVDRTGTIKDLRVVENTSNEAFANVCIQSIQEAKLPPMSEDLAATLPPKGLEVDIPFVVFAN
jgi:outer membrane biosynthesis protein TonB